VACRPRARAGNENAAELYRRQISLGLGGDPRATQKARLALRNLLGTMQLEQGEGDSVWAVYEVHPAELIAAKQLSGVNPCTMSLRSLCGSASNSGKRRKEPYRRNSIFVSRTDGSLTAP
jgi:hypothetical protein